MWVPGHCAIKGNEKADEIANEAHIYPCHMYDSQSNKDVISEILRTKMIEAWSQYNHRYFRLNNAELKPLFQQIAPMRSLQYFSDYDLDTQSLAMRIFSVEIRILAVC